jgi:hypothetical protein
MTTSEHRLLQHFNACTYLICIFFYWQAYKQLLKCAYHINAILPQIVAQFTALMVATKRK